MSITRKLLTASLALVLVASFTVIGCATATKALTADEVAANTIAAYSKVTTVSMDMNIAATIEVTGGSQPMKMTLSEDATAAMDVINRKMHLDMNMDVEIPVLGKQNISTEMYLVDGWTYMKTSVPGLGQQWTKMKLTDELWSAQNQLSQQIEFLKTATEVTLLGSEKVDGVDSYVLEVKPDMKALIDWVMSQQQQQGQTGLDMSKLDLAKLFKSMTIKEWIAKDSSLPVKANIDVVLEMLPTDVGASSSDFEKMTMNMSGQVRGYDYNKPVTIELPQEALNAKEIPQGQ